MVALLVRILLALLLLPAAVSNTVAVEYSENDTSAEPPGVLRSLLVGGYRDYPPYEFLDKSGKPAGFNVDLTRAVAETMCMQV